MEEEEEDNDIKLLRKISEIKTEKSESCFWEFIFLGERRKEVAERGVKGRRNGEKKKYIKNKNKKREEGMTRREMGIQARGDKGLGK